MAYQPIAGFVPYFAKDASGNSADGYYLKGYRAGTTTPLSMASAGDGSGLLVKCKISALGYPLNGTDDEFTPHFDQDYKLALYATSADADGDVTASAVWLTSNYTLSSAGQWQGANAAIYLSPASYRYENTDRTSDLSVGQMVKMEGGADRYGKIESFVFSTHTDVTLYAESIRDSGGTASAVNVGLQSCSLSIQSTDATGSIITWYPNVSDEQGVVDQTYVYGDVRRHGASSSSDIALNAETANYSAGNTVVIPHGSWDIQTNLKLNRFSTLKGDDYQSFSNSIIAWSGGAGTAISTESNQTISGIRLDGASAASSIGLLVGDDTKFLAYINVERNWLYDFDVGMSLSNCFDTRIEQCRVSGNRVGISLDPISFGDGGYTTTVKFSRVYVTDNTEHGLIDNATVKNKMMCIGDNSVFEVNGDATHPQIQLKEGQVNSINEVYIEHPTDAAVGIQLPNGYFQNAYINGFRRAAIDLGTGVSFAVIDNVKFASGFDFTGTHTGASNASVLTDSSATFEIDELAGLSISNDTDGSTGSITSNTATTVTATLSGGTDDDWDAGDAYTIQSASVHSRGGANARYAQMRNCEFDGPPALDSAVVVYDGCGGDMPAGIPQYSHVVTGSVPKSGTGTTPAITRNIEAHLHSDAGTTVLANTQYRFNVTIPVGRITAGSCSLSVTPQSQLPSGLSATVERNSDTTARVVISNITVASVALPATDYMVRVEQFYQIN